MNIHWHKRAAAQLQEVVYYIEGDIVHISAFWDCRREPQRQAAQVK